MQFQSTIHTDVASVKAEIFPIARTSQTPSQASFRQNGLAAEPVWRNGPRSMVRFSPESPRLPGRTTSGRPPVLNARF